MSLNESTIENAALTWLGELGYAVGHGPQAIRSRTLRDPTVAGLPKLLSGELSVAQATA